MRARPILAAFAAFAAAVAVLGAPSGHPLAATSYFALIDGAHADPPNLSHARGVGLFVLDDAHTTLSYDITFSPWVHDEIFSHIHRDGGVGSPAEAIHDLEPGAHKVGAMDMTPDLVQALDEGHLFVNVHTQAFINGEIAGTIVPGSPTPAAPPTWGRIKQFYR